MAGFDADVAAYGLPEAAGRMLDRLVSDWQARGAERTPQDGPLLIAANHPGAFDGFLVVAAQARPDVKIALSDSAVFRGLHALAPHLIYITPDAAQRGGAARSMNRPLRAGGALFTYPAGLPEPDPDVLDGAAAGLERWSPSLELLLRSAPETQVVIAIVGGVLAPECLNYPVVRRQAVFWQRQRLAEYAQVAQQIAFGRRFGLRPRVSFSAPFTAADLRDEGVMPGIITRAQATLKEHLAARSQPATV
jgi:hypothetical protein